jgi:uncharacterized protein YqiB (DUF1249 family)
MSILRTNFNKLKKVIPNLDNPPDHIKSIVEGYMDLNFDLCSTSKQGIVIALSHYYKHPSGDMIADPDMTMLVNIAKRTVEAITYQDIYFYNDVYASGTKDVKLADQLNQFLATWLTNLIEQGHVLK